MRNNLWVWRWLRIREFTSLLLLLQFPSECVLHKCQPCCVCGCTLVLHGLLCSRHPHPQRTRPQSLPPHLMCKSCGNITLQATLPFIFIPFLSPSLPPSFKFPSFTQCLWAPLAFSLGMSHMIQFEMEQVGVHWDNLLISPVSDLFIH